MIEFLSGKKTYIGIVASFILGALAVLGVVDPSGGVFQIAVLAIATFTGVSYRAAMSKAQQK